MLTILEISLSLHSAGKIADSLCSRIQKVKLLYNKSLLEDCVC